MTVKTRRVYFKHRVEYAILFDW